MSGEQVVIVNSKNRKIGVEEKMKAHREGILHRAFSVFLFNSKGEMLIQKRAEDKYHSNGLWSNTVCSHPRPGETYKQAIRRRLMEEMGLVCPVKKLFSFVYNAGFQNGLTENEHDSVFIGRYDGDPLPNPAEIQACRWVPMEELRRDMKENPHAYSVWFKIAMEGITPGDIEGIIK